MSRRDLLEAHRQFYSNAIARKWRETFQTETGPLWDKLIPAQSTSSTSFAHALTHWGVNLLGMETAAKLLEEAMRLPEDEREELAAKLLDSLEPPPGNDLYYPLLVAHVGADVDGLAARADGRGLLDERPP